MEVPQWEAEDVLVDWLDASLNPYSNGSTTMGVKTINSIC